MGMRIALDALAWLEDHWAAAAKIPLEDYPFGSVSAFTVASFLFSIAIILLGMTIFCLVFARLCRTGKHGQKDAGQMRA
jgi:divalent metal cation (Fe/Co/Zn/Cd) transporter